MSLKLRPGSFLSADSGQVTQISDRGSQTGNSDHLRHDELALCVPHPEAILFMVALLFFGTDRLRFPSVGQFLIALGFRFEFRGHFRPRVARNGFHGPLQRNLEHLVHILDEPEGQVGPNFRRNFR
jgi:hypothetical protein